MFCMALASRGRSLRYNILHITVHLGGGIGSVLMNWVESDEKNNHKIICLNRNYYKSFDSRIVFENMKTKPKEISIHIEKADMVVVHFWNHPALFNFLLHGDIPDCRMCFWSHVSGLNAPYVFSEKLIRFGDRFIFASPISFKAKEIINLPEHLKERLSYIWTTGNIDKYFSVEPKPHEGFNIGFIGTLDYSKLHPNFIDFCSKINIPDVQFIMIGDGCDADKIRKEVKERGMESKFVFTGVIDDVRPYLEIIDVFGYPLNADHFGTCEQVLGEAMAAGVIPIVMKNPAEEFILFQSLVKFVCDNEQEYIDNIERLYRDKEDHKIIVSLIQKHVTSLYDSNKMLSSWQKVFDELMMEEKQSKDWPISDEIYEMGGAGVFIESLGEYGHIFQTGDSFNIKRLFNSNLQWKSFSKGSPRQYLDEFPNDKRLEEWVRLSDGGK